MVAQSNPVMILDLLALVQVSSRNEVSFACIDAKKWRTVYKNSVSKKIGTAHASLGIVGMDEETTMTHWGLAGCSSWPAQRG